MFMNMVNSTEQTRLDGGPIDSMTLMGGGATSSSTATTSNGNPSFLLPTTEINQSESIKDKKRNFTLDLSPGGGIGGGGAGGGLARLQGGMTMQLGSNGFTPDPKRDPPNSAQPTDLSGLPTLSTPHLNIMINDLLNGATINPTTLPSFPITPGAFQSTPLSGNSLYLIPNAASNNNNNNNTNNANNNNADQNTMIVNSMAIPVQYQNMAPKEATTTPLGTAINPIHIFKTQQGVDISTGGDIKHIQPLVYYDLQAPKGNDPTNIAMATHHIAGSTTAMPNGTSTLIKLTAYDPNNNTQLHNHNNHHTNHHNDHSDGTVPVHPSMLQQNSKTPVTKKSNKQQQQQQQQLLQQQQNSTGKGAGKSNNKSSPIAGSISMSHRESIASSQDFDESMSDDNGGGGSNSKLENKRKRNREAARKCRERKLQKIADLEKQVNALRESNNAQETRIRTLKEEISQLHVKFENHQKIHHCDLKI